jgi:threonine/homoserine/homoserine lactone efflux protein
MSELESILLAAGTGLLFGFLLSIPVGPVNITISNEGALRGFKFGALVGLGASTMEFIYCALAFTGFATILNHGMIKHLMQVFSFGFMLFLGFRFLLAKTIPKAGKVEAGIEQKLHPHSAFMTGFVQVMCNPNVFLSWVVLGANFISRDWVHRTWESKGACCVGVFFGTSAWFSGLSYAASLGHGKLSEKALLRMQRVSGIVLLILALINGIIIAYDMVKDHQGQH